MSVTKSEFPPIKTLHLGTVSYSDGYQAQELYHKKVLAEELSGCIISLEHRNVLTLGKHADPEMILIDAKTLEADGIECVRTDRGGEVTAHMPGQLVVYPILPLVKLQIQARFYVNALMRAVIETLKIYGIESRCDAEHPGVWVGSNKICAVGVRIRERVSMHGIALNVNNSLKLFEQIIPCGIRNRGVTSMAQELKRVIDIEVLRAELIARLGAQLGLRLELHAPSVAIDSTLQESEL
jgi:lipoyl(octanoyl) transferase